MRTDIGRSGEIGLTCFVGKVTVPASVLAALMLDTRYFSCVVISCSFSFEIWRAEM